MTEAERGRGREAGWGESGMGGAGVEDMVWDGVFGVGDGWVGWGGWFAVGRGERCGVWDLGK